MSETLDTRARLARCFKAVFPGLADDEVAQASPARVAGWDSLSLITLLSVILEEFGVRIELDELALEDPDALSFERLLAEIEARLGR
jgi:acyl carrier protein